MPRVLRVGINRTGYFYSVYYQFSSGLAGVVVPA
jgi:hypothetical protein